MERDKKMTADSGLSLVAVAQRLKQNLIARGPISGVLLSSLLLFSLLLLQGCERSEPPLTVGSNVWPGYESLYLARNKGFFDAEQISLVEKTNATQVIRDFKTGQLDVAALTMDEALTLLAAGQKIQVIALMDFSRGADVLIAKPEIAQLEDLRGRSIVVEKTAVGAIMLQSALESIGLSHYQVSVQNMPVNQHLQAWQRDDIAAIVTFEPIKSLLAAKGGNVLFDSGRTPERIMDVLVVREDIARARREQLQHLLVGHFRALAYMEKHREESAIILSERLKIPPAQVWSSFDGLHIPGLSENRLTLGEPQALHAQVVDLKQLMLKAGLLSHDIAVRESLFNGTFLPEERE